MALRQRDRLDFYDKRARGNRNRTTKRRGGRIIGLICPEAVWGSPLPASRQKLLGPVRNGAILAGTSRSHGARRHPSAGTR
jgi:hypothetical protein